MGRGRDLGDVDGYLQILITDGARFRGLRIVKQDIVALLYIH